MPTPGTEQQTAQTAPNGGLGAAAKQVAEHASALLRLELELAGLELKRKVAALGIGIAFGIGALVLLFFMTGFALAAAAAGIATVLPTWAALLIVTGLLLGGAGMLGLLALGAIKRGTPPVPKQAIHEAELTMNALKSDGRA
jgi:hypothetical protein